MWPIGIVGHLKPGWEDADKIAARLRRFFESLAEVDPVFSCWTRAGTTRHRSGVPLLITMPTKQAEFCLWVEENPVHGVRDGRKAIYGYALRTLTVEENPFTVTEYIVVELSCDNTLLSVRAFVREVEKRLVAIPRVPQAGYALDFTFGMNIVPGWDKQQAECRHGTATDGQNA